MRSWLKYSINFEFMGSIEFSLKSTFIFDAFGTLFKTIPLAETLESIVGRQAGELLGVWRRKQLEYSWLRNQMEAYISFDQITAEALNYAMRKLGVNDQRIRDLLLPVYEQPELIDHAASLLSSLKKMEKQTAILSNGTMTMLERGVRGTGIKVLIDRLLSVDQIGIYKPSPRVYQMALYELETPIEDIVFFSSNQWDVSGASTFGLDAVWVNQYDETKESLPFGQVLEVSNLAEAERLISKGISR